mmetsp:Transcript_35945/g.57753  ORF Transcript_35945/g.57753 Transcript_35945/m.57753 type:complete len:98 (-) Transcript_35945:90-383(-)
MKKRDQRVRVAYCSRDGRVSIIALTRKKREVDVDISRNNDAQESSSIIVTQEEVRWKMKGEVFSSPIMMGTKLLIGCRDDKLWSFRLPSLQGENAHR